MYFKLWGEKKLVIILNMVTPLIPLYILIGFFWLQMVEKMTQTNSERKCIGSSSCEVQEWTQR